MYFEKLKHLIVYCSPSGTTRHIAEVIRTELEHMEIEPRTLDLGEGGDNSMILKQIQDADPICLYVGTPVYVNRALPPVLDFIAQLPETEQSIAVPFATWGGATSGIALHDLADALTAKGYAIAGAAKVLAVHSMMYCIEEPLGKGHPDEADDDMVRELVRAVRQKVANGEFEGLPLSVLAYQPEAIHARMSEMSLEKAKGHMPARTVDREACTKCGVCRDVCPTGSIEYSPYPEFTESCICCFSCVKECPEGAIHADLSQLEARIRERTATFNERPPSRIFV